MLPVCCLKRTTGPVLIFKWEICNHNVSEMVQLQVRNCSVVNFMFLFERHTFSNTTVLGKIRRAPGWMGSVCSTSIHGSFVVSGTTGSFSWVPGQVRSSCHLQLTPHVSSCVSEKHLNLTTKLSSSTEANTTQYLNSAKSLLNVTATAVAAWALTERGKELKPFWGLEKESKYHFKY